MAKTGKLTGTNVPWKDPDGEIRGFRGNKGSKLRICVSKWDPKGGVADADLLDPMMMTDCVSGGGSEYSSALICEKGTSIWLRIFWDPPSYGMCISITNGDGTVYLERYRNDKPWEQQSMDVLQYTAGPFANEAIVVDDIPGLEAHGVDYLSAHKMTVSVWPLTKVKDPDGGIHGPDFPPKPPQVAAMASFDDSGSSGGMFQAMAAVSSGNQTTVTVGGGGIRGGDDVDPLGTGKGAWLEEDKSPNAMVNIPIWIFVGTRAHIDSQVDMNTIDDSEFG